MHLLCGRALEVAFEAHHERAHLIIAADLAATDETCSSFRERTKAVGLSETVSVHSSLHRSLVQLKAYATLTGALFSCLCVLLRR